MNNENTTQLGSKTVELKQPTLGYTRHEFSDIGEAKRILNVLEKAEEREVFYSHPDKGTIKAANNTAIFNKNTGELAKIHSNKYLLINHDEAFGAVVDGLSQLNLNFKGTITEFENRAYMRVRFVDEQLKDDAQGIDLGFQITNSYDGSLAFSGGLYAVRLVCSNGMMAYTTVPETQFYVTHVGNKTKVETNVSKWIRTIIEKSQELQVLIDKSIEESIEWDLMKKVIENFKYLGKKHQEGILDAIKTEQENNKGKLTRWVMYNGFTRYATHGLNISFAMEQHLQKLAEKTLANPFERLVEITVPR